MRALLTAIGTSDDVLPILALGESLRARGHAVTLVTHEQFAVQAYRAGIGFAPLGNGQQYLDLLSEDVLLWDADQGSQKLALWATALVPELYAILRAYVDTGASVIVAHPLDLASRLLEVEQRATVISAVLSPFGFGVAARNLFDAELPPPLGALRASGQPAWNLSRLLTLGLFPSWFASSVDDCFDHVQMTGFPVPDGVVPLPREIDEFLLAGPRPIAFIPGPRVEFSVNVDPQRWIEAAVEACRSLDRRGLIIGRLPCVPEHLPPSVMFTPSAPLSPTLARCVAVVHHGGIAAVAAALASGIPQVALPVCHDQPDNAKRLPELGVGDWVGGTDPRGPEIAEALARLVAAEEVKRRCAELAVLLRAGNTLETTCRLIEQREPRAGALPVMAVARRLAAKALPGSGCV